MSIVSVTLCEPFADGIVADGANVAVAPIAAGDIEAVSVMGFGYDPLEGATVRLKVAACPGFTLAAEVKAVRVKSPIVISKGNGDDVPPPGAGFFTEMLRVAACAKSLAGIVACRCAELK